MPTDHEPVTSRPNHTTTSRIAGHAFRAERREILRAQLHQARLDRDRELEDCISRELDDLFVADSGHRNADTDLSRYRRHLARTA